MTAPFIHCVLASMSSPETNETGNLGPDRLLSIVYVGMFAALVTVGSYLSFPLPLSPVPVSLQTLFAVLAGILLGPVRGTITLLLYLVLGIMGIPVFSGGTSGLAHFLGPTGGYLVGFVVCALVAGLVYRALAAVFLGSKTRESMEKADVGLSTKQDYPKLMLAGLIAAVLGYIALYLIGIPWLKVVTGRDWPTALKAGLTPFLVGDTLKAVVVGLLTPLGVRLFAD